MTEFSNIGIFCKGVNSGVSGGTYNQKTKSIFDFNEATENKNVSNKKKTRNFFNLVLFHMKILILLAA